MSAVVAWAVRSQAAQVAAVDSNLGSGNIQTVKLPKVTSPPPSSGVHSALEILVLESDFASRAQVMFLVLIL